MPVRYLFFWLLLALVAIGNGILRQSVYAPFVSALAAHQISTLTGIFFTTALVYWLNRHWPIESSRQAWRIPAFDLLQVHNLVGIDTQLPTLRELKDAGRVRYIGMSTSSGRQYEAFADVMRREDMDFIQVNYSLASRDAADVILPLAADRGMAVLVNVPFGRGRLFDAVGERPLPDWAGEFDCESWGQFFLKYIVGHPAVTCVIPGTAKPHYATDNMGAAMGRLPDAAMRAKMEEFFDSLT